MNNENKKIMEYVNLLSNDPIIQKVFSSLKKYPIGIERAKRFWFLVLSFTFISDVTQKEIEEVIKLVNNVKIPKEIEDKAKKMFE